MGLHEVCHLAIRVTGLRTRPAKDTIYARRSMRK